MLDAAVLVCNATAIDLCISPSLAGRESPSDAETTLLDYTPALVTNVLPRRVRRGQRGLISFRLIVVRVVLPEIVIASATPCIRDRGDVLHGYNQMTG